MSHGLQHTLILTYTSQIISYIIQHTLKLTQTRQAMAYSTLILT